MVAQLIEVKMLLHERIAHAGPRVLRQIPGFAQLPFIIILVAVPNLFPIKRMLDPHDSADHCGIYLDPPFNSKRGYNLPFKSPSEGIAKKNYPLLGRFLQPNPKQSAVGDYNLYRYCHNDPGEYTRNRISSWSKSSVFYC